MESPRPKNMRVTNLRRRSHRCGWYLLAWFLLLNVPCTEAYSVDSASRQRAQHKDSLFHPNRPASIVEGGRSEDLYTSKLIFGLSGEPPPAESVQATARANSKDVGGKDIKTGLSGYFRGDDRLAYKENGKALDQDSSQGSARLEDGYSSNVDSHDYHEDDSNYFTGTISDQSRYVTDEGLQSQHDGEARVNDRHDVAEGRQKNFHKIKDALSTENEWLGSELSAIQNADANVKNILEERDVNLVHRMDDEPMIAEKGRVQSAEGDFTDGGLKDYGDSLPERHAVHSSDRNTAPSSSHLLADGRPFSSTSNSDDDFERSTSELLRYGVKTNGMIEDGSASAANRKEDVFRWAKKIAQVPTETSRETQQTLKETRDLINKDESRLNYWPAKSQSEIGIKKALLYPLFERLSGSRYGHPIAPDSSTRTRLKSHLPPSAAIDILKYMFRTLNESSRVPHLHVSKAGAYSLRDRARKEASLKRDSVARKAANEENAGGEPRDSKVHSRISRSHIEDTALDHTLKKDFQTHLARTLSGSFPETALTSEPRMLASRAISYSNRNGEKVMFTVGTEEVTFDVARRRCKAHGGDLVSVGDTDEHTFITTNVLPEPGHYWLGLTDRENEGEFQWLDGSALTFTNWTNMEPDNGGGNGDRRQKEDCAVMNPAFDWSDVTCTSRFRYICKTSRMTQNISEESKTISNYTLDSSQAVNVNSLASSLALSKYNEFKSNPMAVLMSEVAKNAVQDQFSEENSDDASRMVEVSVNNSEFTDKSSVESSSALVAREPVRVKQGGNGGSSQKTLVEQTTFLKPLKSIAPTDGGHSAENSWFADLPQCIKPPGGSLRLVNLLARKLAPGFLVDYSTRFSPHKNIMMKVCGRACGKTASKVLLEPNEAGDLCGRSCARTLLSMSPTQLWTVLAAIKSNDHVHDEATSSPGHMEDVLESLLHTPKFRVAALQAVAKLISSESHDLSPQSVALDGNPASNPPPATVTAPTHFDHGDYVGGYSQFHPADMVSESITLPGVDTFQVQTTIHSHLSPDYNNAPTFTTEHHHQEESPSRPFQDMQTYPVYGAMDGSRENSHVIASPQESGYVSDLSTMQVAAHGDNHAHRPFDYSNGYGQLSNIVYNKNVLNDYMRGSENYQAYQRSNSTQTRHFVSPNAGGNDDTGGARSHREHGQKSQAEKRRSKGISRKYIVSRHGKQVGFKASSKKDKRHVQADVGRRGMVRKSDYESRHLRNGDQLLRITIKSVGCFDPPYHGSSCDETVGSIIVNGVEMSQNNPGFNIAIIDLRSGTVDQTMSFDTHGEAGAYEKLVAFLNSVGQWKVICIAVKEDAKNYLPESALASFAKIGAREIASSGLEYRGAFAFVGLSGPEEARPYTGWLREEVSKAGQGPSVIQVDVTTGNWAYHEIADRVPLRFIEPSPKVFTAAPSRQPKGLDFPQEHDTYGETKTQMTTFKERKSDDGVDWKNDSHDLDLPVRPSSDMAILTSSTQGRGIQAGLDRSLRSGPIEVSSREDSNLKDLMPASTEHIRNVADASENTLSSNANLKLSQNPEASLLRALKSLGVNIAQSPFADLGATKVPLAEAASKVTDNPESSHQETHGLASWTGSFLEPKAGPYSAPLTESMLQNALFSRLPIASNDSTDSPKDSLLGTPNYNGFFNIAMSTGSSINPSEGKTDHGAESSRAPGILDRALAAAYNGFISTSATHSMANQITDSFANSNDGKSSAAENLGQSPDSDASNGLQEAMILGSRSVSAENLLKKGTTSTGMPASSSRPNVNMIPNPMLGNAKDISSSFLEQSIKEEVARLKQLLSQQINPGTQSMSSVQEDTLLSSNLHKDQTTVGPEERRLEATGADSKTTKVIKTKTADQKMADLQAKAAHDAAVASFDAAKKLVSVATAEKLPKSASYPGNASQKQDVLFGPHHAGIDPGYGSMGLPVHDLPYSEYVGAAGVDTPMVGDAAALAAEVPSEMEAAAEATGTRNVAEARLASALSSLGIPDAGSTGIASLMASGFVALGANNLKDAALKLGLAAKLAKAIADLGGRGAASAAGIASLCEVLKDGRDLSVARLADRIGQALQRVGGAGAAVTYTALAAALKAVGATHSPGGLVGGLILALAEQGAAPGTAGLAALAAGLGGSGADALASGLGGTLPNIIEASRTNNYMANPPAPEDASPVIPPIGVETLTSDTTGPSISPPPSSNQFPPLSILGDHAFHPTNIDNEYTGQGPIGSSSQGYQARPVFSESGPAPGTQGLPPQGPKQQLAFGIPPVSGNAVINLQRLIASALGHGGVSLQDIAARLQQARQRSNEEPTPTSASVSNGGAIQSKAAPSMAPFGGGELVEVGNRLDGVRENSAAIQDASAQPEQIFEKALGVISNLTSAEPPQNTAANMLAKMLMKSMMDNKVGAETEGLLCDVGLRGSKKCDDLCYTKKPMVGRLVELQSSGTTGMIKVNGEDWSKDEPGFNVVVLDYNSGAIQASEAFDTDADGGGAKAMSNFIRSLPKGKVVLVAVKGDAGRLMIEEAYQSLASIGAESLMKRKLKAGDSYILAGMTGDKPSWAKEVQLSDSLSPASLSLPIILGPGSIKDSCQCLKWCLEAEAKPSLEGEKSYSEIGGVTPVQPGKKREKEPGNEFLSPIRERYSSKLDDGTDVNSEQEEFQSRGNRLKSLSFLREGKVRYKSLQEADAQDDFSRHSPTISKQHSPSRLSNRKSRKRKRRKHVRKTKRIETLKRRLRKLKHRVTSYGGESPRRMSGDVIKVITPVTKHAIAQNITQPSFNEVLRKNTTQRGLGSLHPSGGYARDLDGLRGDGLAVGLSALFERKTEQEDQLLLKQQHASNEAKTSPVLEDIYSSIGNNLHSK